ncbi:MAG: LacI family DNA-binding transcriptional regulator [Anaerolineae bacterium]
MTQSRPTMRDVANLAGVSIATVSHVVNGTRHVEEDTKARVLASIQELGYRPSGIARSLATNETKTIGVVVSDVRNHFFGELLSGIEDVMRPQGYRLTLCNTAEILERETLYLNYLLEQRVDGIIAAATSRKWDVLTQFDQTQTKVVYVDRLFEGLSAPYVGVDNVGAAYEGTQYLIDKGHRKIGILAGFQRLSTMRERLRGYKQAMEDAGLDIRDEWIVEGPLEVLEGKKAMLQLLGLPNPPTAVFISNNFLSLGALLAVKEAGTRCPEGVSMLGFDDHPWAEVSNPPLTVIRQPSEEVGRTAAELLLELINGDEPDEIHIQLQCELVQRESCCAPVD